MPVMLKQIQAEGYSVFAFFKRSKYFFKRASMFISISALFALAYFACARFSSSTAFVATYYSLFTLFSCVAACAVLFEKVKTPLVYTKRLMRLYAFSAALTVAANVAVFLVLHDTRFMLYVAFSPFSAFFACCTANAVATPFERLNNFRYVEKTRRALLENDCLTKIMITGSFGKTTVKNVLYAMLSKKYETIKTEKNFNTPMGIVKSAKRISGLTRVFIAEAGARRRGDIKKLAKMIRPQYAIITGVTTQHLETFKTLDNIYAEKFSVLDYIDDDGLCVVNRNGIEREISLPKNAIFVGEKGDFVYADEIKLNSLGSNFCLYIDGKKYEVRTKLLGRHNVDDVVSAAALAKKLGVSDEDIIGATESLKPVPHRLELINNGRINVIDDTYNGNPVGAARALEVLREFDSRRIVVTPGLVELGKNKKYENEKLGREIAEVANLVLVVGSLGEYIKKGLLENGFPEENALFFKKLSDAERFFPDLFSANDTVLFLNDLPDEYN